MHISIVCEEDNGMSKCNVSIMDTRFCDDFYPTSTTAKPTTPEECKCNTNSEYYGNSESEATSISVVTNNSGLSNSQSFESIIAAILGALVGLLLVLLVIVTSILVWTCWLLKKRGEMKYNAEYQIR